jgi:predicted HTH transcriptional regulator
LVYLRRNERMTNEDYRRLNRVDALTAGRELRGLVDSELAEQQSAKRWAYYTLKVSRALPMVGVSASSEARILAYIREHGSITNEGCRTLLSVEQGQAWYLLRKLATSGAIKPIGSGRWRKYVLA